MNIETRIERLEDSIGITGEIPPLIRIDATDCRKGSKDKGTPLLAIVPGQLGKIKGTTLFRGKTEAPGSFLERCNAKYSEIYP